MLTKTEIIEYVRYVLSEENLSYADSIPVFFSDRKRGRVHWGYRGKPEFVELPNWMLKHCDEFCVAYAIHEACHCIAQQQHNHDAIFKKAERKWLKHFGLVPKYAKIYVKELHTLNGQCVYSRTWGTGCNVNEEK